MLYCKLWLIMLANWWIYRLTTADDTLVQLYRSLLKNYDKDIRPSLRHDMPVNVSFTFVLSHIIDVDERNQIFTCLAWIHQSWLDFNLIWDPRRFDGITKVHVPYDRVWRPDIILYNNAASDYSKSVLSTDIIVSYDGNVSWTMAGIFKSSCELDVRYYPFDYQNCILKFASWAYDGTKIDIITESSADNDQTNYMMSTEWHLHFVRSEKNSVVYSCCPEPYPFVDIQITIQRRPIFFVFHLILPCVLTSVIALLSFYMPTDAGEKVSLGITSLLSTTVFLMLVAEGMPPTSEALPLIGIYYGVTIFIVSIATAMSALTLNVAHHGYLANKALPELVQRLMFDFVARLVFVRIEHYHSINDHVEYFYAKQCRQNSLLSTSSTTWKTGGGQLSAGERSPARRTHSEVCYRSSPSRNNTHLSPERPTNNYSQVNKLSICSLSSVGKKRVSFSDNSISSLASAGNNHSSGGAPTVYNPTTSSHITPIICATITSTTLNSDRHPTTCVGNSANTRATALGPHDGVTRMSVEKEPSPPASKANSVGMLNGGGGGGSPPKIPSEPPPPSSTTSPLSSSSFSSPPSQKWLKRPTNDRKNNETETTISTPSSMTSLDTFEKEFLRVLDRVHGTIERNEMRIAEKDRRHAMFLEWQQVAQVIDRFFFFLFLCATALTSLIVFQKHFTEDIS